MDLKTMGVFASTLDDVSRAIKRAVERLEPHGNDPVIAEYLANLADVINELDGTVYTVEATMEGLTYEGNR